MSNTSNISQALNSVTQAIAINNAAAQSGSAESQQMTPFPILSSSWDKQSKNFKAEEKQFYLYLTMHRLLKNSKKDPSQLEALKLTHINEEPINGFSIIMQLLNEIAQIHPETFQAMLENEDSNQVIIYFYVLDLTHHKDNFLKNNVLFNQTFMANQSKPMQEALEFLSEFFLLSPLTPNTIYDTNTQILLASPAQPISLIKNFLAKITNPISDLCLKFCLACKQSNETDRVSAINHVLDELTPLTAITENTSIITKSFLQLTLSSFLLAQLEKSTLSLNERQRLSAKCLPLFNTDIARMPPSTNTMYMSTYYELWNNAKRQFDAFNLYHQHKTAYQQITHDVSERHLQQFLKCITPEEHSPELLLGLSYSIGTLIIRSEHARNQKQSWPFSWIDEKTFWQTCSDSLRGARFNSPQLIERCTLLVDPIILGLIKHSLYKESYAYSNFILEFSTTFQMPASYNKQAYSTLGLFLNAFTRANHIDTFKNNESLNIITHAERGTLPLYITFIHHMLNALFQTCVYDLMNDTLDKSQLIIEHLISILACGEQNNANQFHKKLNEIAPRVIAYQHLLNIIEDITPNNGIKDLLTKLESNSLFIEVFEKNPKLLVKLNKNPLTKMNLLKKLLDINVYSYIDALRQAIIVRLIQYAVSAFHANPDMPFEMHQFLVKVLNFVKPILLHMKLDSVEDDLLKTTFQFNQLELKRDAITIALCESMDEKKQEKSTHKQNSSAKKKHKKKKEKKTSVNHSVPIQTPLNDDQKLKDMGVSQKTPSLSNGIQEEQVEDAISSDVDNGDWQQVSAVLKKSPPKSTAATGKKLDKKSTHFISGKKIDTVAPSAPMPAHVINSHDKKHAPDSPAKTFTSHLDLTDIGIEQVTKSQKRKSKAQQKLPPVTTPPKEIVDHSITITGNPRIQRATATAQAEAKIKNKVDHNNEPNQQRPIDTAVVKETVALEKSDADGKKEPHQKFNINTTPPEKTFASLSPSHEKNDPWGKRALALAAAQGTENTDDKVSIAQKHKQETHASQDAISETQSPSLSAAAKTFIPTRPSLMNKKKVIAHIGKSNIPSIALDILKVLNLKIEHATDEGFPLTLTGKAVSSLYTGKGTINDYDCLAYNLSLEALQQLVIECAKDDGWICKCDIVGKKSHPILLIEIESGKETIKIDMSSLMSQRKDQTFEQALLEDAKKRDILSTSYHLPLIDSQEAFYRVYDSLGLPFYLDKKGHHKTYLNNEIIEINQALAQTIMDTTGYNFFTYEPLRIFRTIKEMTEQPSALVGALLASYFPLLKDQDQQHALWINFLYIPIEVNDDEAMKDAKLSKSQLHRNQLNTKLSTISSRESGKALPKILKEFKILEGIVLATMSHYAPNEMEHASVEQKSAKLNELLNIIFWENLLAACSPFNSIEALVESNLRPNRHANEIHLPAHYSH